jgi:nucleoside-triphosphatase THEP1
MLTIITGGIGSGKTTRLIELFKRQVPGSADGFVSMRQFIEQKPQGYELVRLLGPERAQLAINKLYYHGQYERPMLFDQFIFDTDAFAMGCTIIEAALKLTSVRSLFIDEIGPIELSGAGFSKPFESALSHERTSTKDIFVCIRSGCLEAAISHFGITRYELFD